MNFWAKSDLYETVMEVNEEKLTLEAYTQNHFCVLPFMNHYHDCMK